MLYKYLLNKIDSSDTLSSKLEKYQSATLVKGALLEGPALLSVVATYLSNNLAFLIVTMLLVVIMYFKFPTKEKFINELVLSLKEKSELDTL